MPLCILTEQNNKSQNKLKLLSIQVKNPPNKMEYYFGDDFDPTGMIVTASYGTDNFVLSTVEITNYTVSKLSYDEPITITYTEKGYICTTTLDIIVKPVPTAIGIFAKPTKLEYIYGENYDLSGIEIKLMYFPTLSSYLVPVTTFDYSPKTPEGIGQQTILISYESETGKILTTELEVTVSRKPIVKPTIAQSLKYNGTLQSINAISYWNNYDPDCITIGGAISATNAGIYTVTFTPKNNYCWEDETTTSIESNWQIIQAPGNLTLSNTSVELNGDNYQNGIDIFITRLGTGEISYTPKEISGLIISLNGNILNIKGDGNTNISSKTITVKVTADNNYTAPSDKNIAVNAEYWSWGTNGSIADEAWFSGLKNYLQNHSGKEEWIGQIKSIILTQEVLGTTTHYITCIDVNKDGNNTATFQTTNMLNTLFTTGNIGNNLKTAIKTNCQNYYDAFPGKNSIKTISKGTNTLYDSSSIEYTDEQVFIPSIHEMGLANYSSAPNTGEYTNGINSAYSYYSNNDNRIKKQGDNGDVQSYWTRSRSTNSSTYYCIISNTGSASRANSSNYSSKRGFAPTFVIG